MTALTAIAVLLLIPVVLFRFAGFQVALTLLLAPPAAWCLLRAPARLRQLYLLCTGAGLLSIGLAAIILGDSLQTRYFLSLALIMTPPLYFFLGWYLCERYVLNDVLEVLGAVSSIFLLILAVQVVATGAQVRLEFPSVLNVDFLGLPLYGSYGVLSLGSLIVGQLFVTGAAFIASPHRWTRVLLLAGFGAAAFLIMGSNGRTIHLVLPYVLVILGAAALVGRRPIRRKVVLLLAVATVAVVYSAERMAAPIRIVTTIRALLGMPDPNPKADRADYEGLSSGRDIILRDALMEVRMSPIFGTGFASFGRIHPGATAVSRRNRTTHVHYLTVLWKGGVIFLVPYIVLLAALWRPAVRASLAVMKEEVLFLGFGLVFLFTVFAVSWDILLVPSAGALGFFILGAVAAPELPRG